MYAKFQVNSSSLPKKSKVGVITTNKNKNGPLRYDRQYIFLTLFNTLYSKNSRYMIYNINYRRDASHKTFQRDNKETIKNKEKHKTTRKNLKMFFEILLCISSYHS